MNEDPEQLAREAAEFLQRGREKILAKLANGETLSLFDALESIGAYVDPIWDGEWEGPILFHDCRARHMLILVERSDHDAFDAWYQAHKNFSGEELQDHARNALVRMVSRPIDPKDFA